MMYSKRKLPTIAIAVFFLILLPLEVEASEQGVEYYKTTKSLLHKDTSLLRSSEDSTVNSKSKRFVRNLDQQTDDILHGSSNSTDATDTRRGLTDLVELVPFDVRIALTQNDGIQIFEVSNIVTSWMNDVFSRHLKEYGFTSNNGYATFQAVVLLKRQNRILRTLNTPMLRRTATEDSASTGSNGSYSSSGTNTTQHVGDSYIAKFKGGAYFVRKEKDSMSVPEHDVLVIQQMAFYNTTILLEKLQLSTAIGLGSAVVDVRVFLNTNSDDSETDSTNNSTSNGTDSTSNANATSTKQLQTVIIAAIAVAVLAFLFLLAAIYWAYRYDKKNRDAYLVNNTTAAAAASAESKKKNAVDRTESETTSPKTLTEHPPPVKTIYQARYPAYPTEIVAGLGTPNYPESVISDSIIDDQRSVRSFAGFGHTPGHENTDDEVEDVIDIKSQLSVDLQTNSVPPLDDEISASLSQYYRSGMGKVGTPISPQSAGNGKGNRVLTHNDAASVSSMESYGYSLDGTIPTIMSPNNNTNSRSGGGASNVLGNHTQSNPYMAHLERIGGLPVEPDLRHLENLTIEDIDVGSETDDDTNTKGEGTIGAENDLCTIDGSMTIPFK